MTYVGGPLVIAKENIGAINGGVKRLCNIKTNMKKETSLIKIVIL